MFDKFAPMLELTLKVVLAVIAGFGVFKFFAEQKAAEESSARANSIQIIDKFAGDTEQINAREVFFQFWQSHPEFTRHVRSNALTTNEYENFILKSYPHYGERAALRTALLLSANFFDQAFYCRHSRLCDALILDDYLCSTAIKWHETYRPFYELLNSSIASTDLGAGLQKYSELCLAQSRAAGVANG